MRAQSLRAIAVAQLHAVRGFARASAGTFALLCLFAAAGRASDFSFSGTLATDDDQKSFFFTLAQPGTVTIKTSSYASGGFDPSLAVFDSGGNLIASNQDGGCANVAPNPTTGLCWDAYLNLTLPPGTYRAVLTQSNNVANGPTANDSFAYTGQVNFTAPPGASGSFYDATGVQNSPSFSMGVQAVAAAAPQFLISQQTPPGGQVGIAYAYRFAATGGVTPYTWSVATGSLPPGLALTSDGSLSGMPTAFGTYDFSLQASDSGSPAMSAGPASFEIVVIPPTLQITSSSLTTWVVNNAFSQTLGATGGYPPYTWSVTGNPGGLSVSQAGVASGTPTATGPFNVPVQVMDSHGVAVQAQLTWQVNPALTITSMAALPSGVTNHAYSGFAFTSTGGAAVTPVWSLTSGTLPSGVALTAAGILQGTPGAHGSYPVTVQVTDGIQPARQNATLVVYDPLTITSTSLPGGTAGASYGPFPLSATGGSGTYTWSAAPPAGLTVSSTGQVSGTPATPGAATFNATVTDATAGLTASAMVSISIAYPPLQITSSGTLTEVAAGSTLSQVFTATGGKQPYTWSGSGLPAGLALDPNSGTLSGPATAGNFSFSVQVTDALGTTIPLNANLAVLGISGTSGGVTSTTSTYSQSFTAVGGTPPYVFSGTAIPAGLSLSGSGLLSGRANAAGSYSFTIKITDGASVSATANFFLNVNAPAPLSIPGGALTGAIVAVPYSSTLGASGGVGPYTFSVIGGSLPDGLMAASSGTISGTPSRSGSFTFTVTARDSSGGTATGTVTINVAPPSLTAPTISQLPNGIVGADYFAQVLQPAGGTPPYTFVISAGSLPAGIAINSGQISGTPQAATTANFTLTITDSANPPAALTESLSIKVNPAAADLLLSSSSLSFSLTSGATAVPAGASVVVRSSDVQQTLDYTAALAPAAAWVDVSGGGTTPGSIVVSLDPSALSLGASPTPYSATIAVTCTPPSPCAGNTQYIQVSLNVTAPPAALSLPNGLLAFSYSSGGTPQVSPQTLTIQNSGGGLLNITSVSAADGFVSVGGALASVAPGPGASVSVGIAAAGLAPGFYRSTITVVSSAGTASVPVTFYYAQSGSMQLNPSGQQFMAQAGSSPGNSSGSFVVSVAGAGSVSWNASSNSPWLLVGTSSGTSTSISPGSVSFSLDPVGVAALAPGAYYGQIAVTSANASNSPQVFEVVLSVTAGTPAQPNPAPAGLVFISSAGAPVPPQTVTVYTSSAAAVGFQASAGMTPWLSVTPTTGTTSTMTSGVASVAVDPSRLTPGVYQGGVSFSLPSAAAPTVNVTLIVTAQALTPQAVTSSATPKAACAPTKLVPTQTGLTNNFAQPAAWPVPLTIKLLDDCGSAIANGAMIASFNNGDPVLPLQATDTSSGIYSATWTPRSPSPQVTISARASAAGFPAVTALLVGVVKPNQAPVLTPHGTLHVFDPLVGGSLGPGNIVQIYGSNLAAQTLSATAIPLPTTLAGTSVVIGGIQAPLYFVSPGQINAQVPFELAPGSAYQVLVSANGALTTPDAIQVTNDAPGIAAFAGGQIIAQHLDGTLVTPTAPVAPGDFVVFYMAGLGLTDNPVVTGGASPSTTLARPLIMPTLTLAGEDVPILFAGLTPGLVGLYQVNFQVPADAADGDLQLVISQSGVASNATILPVKK